MFTKKIKTFSSQIFSDYMFSKIGIAIIKPGFEQYKNVLKIKSVL